MQTHQFQQLAELLPGGAALLTAEGRIVALNAVAAANWEAIPAKVIGQPFINLLSPPSDEFATFLDVCLGSEQVVSISLIFDAARKTIAVQGRRIDSDSPGEPAMIMLVETTPAACYEAQQNFHDAVDVRDRLMGLMVHDFRNGLASVPMGFDILEMEHGKNETIKLLRRQVDRLVMLVDEVLDVSRLLRGKIALHCEPVVVQELLQELAKNVVPLLKQRNIEFLLDLPPEPVLISLDPQRMLQAWKALVLQRSKNIHAGGVVTFSVKRTPGDVVIRMQDSGQALDAGLLPHVFDIVAQLQYVGKENRTQFEMELALAGGLIALQGAEIHARPLPTPPGMETSIRLPIDANR